MDIIDIKTGRMRHYDSLTYDPSLVQKELPGSSIDYNSLTMKNQNEANKYILLQNQTLPHIEESVETTEDKAKSENAPTHNNMDSDDLELEAEAAKEKKKIEVKNSKITKVAKKMMKLKTKKQN